jgi:hypothetical protein
MSGGAFRVAEAEAGVWLRPAGSWTAEGARALFEAVSALRRVEPAREVRIELDDASALDATGESSWEPKAWMLPSRHASCFANVCRRRDEALDPWR